jgi:Phosphoserine phosphatase RsbU, N-terminal domain
VTEPDDLTALRLNYRVAFLRYLGMGGEAALHDAYLLGRASLARCVTTMDLARIHHEVLLGALRETSVDGLETVASRAAEFLLQVLAVYEMSAEPAGRQPVV